MRLPRWQHWGPRPVEAAVGKVDSQVGWAVSVRQNQVRTGASARPANWLSWTSKTMKVILVRGRMSHTCLQLRGDTRSCLHGLLCYQQEWFISNANATGSHIVSHFRGQNAKRWLCTRMGPERDGSGVLWLRQRSGLLPWLHSSKSTWVVGLLCSQPCTTWEQPQGNQSREFTVTAWDPGPLLPVLAGHNPFWAGTAWLADHHGVDEPTGGALAGKSF